MFFLKWVVSYMKKNNTTDFAYHLTKFFTEYLTLQRNLSTNTISTYRYTFKLLLTYFNEEKHIKPSNLSISTINRKNIEDFIVWLQKTRACSASTCNQRLAALKSFFSVFAI